MNLRIITAALAAAALAGCYWPPMPPPPSSTQHLYVGNDAAAGGVQQYSLPISGGSTPSFALATQPHVTAVAVNTNPSSELAAGETGGSIQFFPPPLSSGSVPSATFQNGTALGVGQIFFDTNVMFATTNAGYVNRYSSPFPTSTPFAIVDPALFTTYGVVRDTPGDVYVSNVVVPGTITSDIVRLPTSGSTIVSQPLTGTTYRQLAINGGRLFAASDAGAAGRVDVYTLPMAAGATPAFAIANGVAKPFTVAFDSSGNLYVGNSANSTVTMYVPPFSAASGPTVTMPVAGSYSVVAIGIGP
jgi:hypothetical protein